MNFVEERGDFLDFVHHYPGPRIKTPAFLGEEGWITP